MLNSAIHSIHSFSQRKKLTQSLSPGLVDNSVEKVALFDRHIPAGPPIGAIRRLLSPLVQTIGGLLWSQARWGRLREECTVGRMSGADQENVFRLDLRFCERH